MYAINLWNYYNSYSKSVLNKWLAKRQSVFDYNFAASPQIKNNSQVQMCEDFRKYRIWYLSDLNYIINIFSIISLT